VKIYIGPYNNHWSAYDLENKWLKFNHKKEYYDVNDSELTKTDKFVESVCDIIQKVLNVTVNKFIVWRGRKEKIRIDHYDTWSMDHTLSLIILPMLKQLRDTKHGSPMVDDADVPEHLRSTAAPPKKNEWDSDDLIHDRWSWVLDEMIWTFEQLVDEDSDSQFYSGKHDIYWEKREDGTSEMKRGPNDTHKYDKEGHDAHSKRISNGLILFGKYYRGLWD
jgi:hypothetical protein